MNALDPAGLDLSSLLASRELARLLVSPAAVLSVSAAARLLPWSDARARDWLRRVGVVRHVEGCDLVLWSDVLVALTEASPSPVSAPRATTRGRRPTKPALKRGGGL